MVGELTQGGMKFFNKHKASYFLTYGINYLKTNAVKERKLCFHGM